ncbi:MAG: formylglycine-generating enzyme family protein [Hyphomonas sp.]|nr:formylglycine-generating enzyme family protein [Hyphomonas sp.]
MSSCHPAAAGFAHIPAGSFLMGSDAHYAEEGPQQAVAVAAFDIDRFEVTNAQFAQFITESGYVTSAERATKLGFPESGSAVFSRSTWSFVAGADWRHPDGPDSDIQGRDHDPVVHVSFEDAQAYADWAGRALPTEAQWEYAARGGLNGQEYAWGDTLTPGGNHLANTWQGLFPVADTGADGHAGRAVVGCYPANGYGLYDMIGNVWEWTADPYFPDRRFGKDLPADRLERPIGFDPRQPGVPVGVIKGGSFLCAPTGCRRYRPAARHAQDTGLGTNHIGFRTVSRTAARDAMP